MSTTARVRGLRALLAAGLGVALLAGCQTGQVAAEPDVEPSEEPVASEPAAEPEPEPEQSEPSEPTEPAEPGDPVVNGDNSITFPLPGTSVAGPGVTATGEGTAFEATLLYRVLVAGTEDVVVEDFTTAGANGEVGPWTIELTLEPGDYTLQVWEPDMSDGEGEGAPSRNLVETTFTVT